VNLFIDIGHPAHVHYFKNFYREMIGRGHDVLVTARKKEISQELLKAFNIPFKDRGEGGGTFIGKLLYLPKGNALLLREARTFKPDLFLSFSSPYAAQVSSLFGKPHIAFDDTEHAMLGRMMYRPFTDVVLSPDSYKGKRYKKQVFFKGYLELCYLHPNRFKPGNDILRLLQIHEDDSYVVLRFVSWQATHDAGHTGISLENKRKAVKEFSKHAKVWISSEEELPADLKPYEIKVPPDKIHDVLYHGALFYGESATMTAESAVLGTPAIYLDNIGRGYTDDLEKNYGLVFNYTESPEDQVLSIQKGMELLQMPAEKRNEIFQKKREKMLSEKIDVTQFLIDFVEKFMDNRNKK
jgi:uncharacterized protein